MYILHIHVLKRRFRVLASCAMAIRSSIMAIRNRAFSGMAPMLQNSLPGDIHKALLLLTFKLIITFQIMDLMN